MAKRYKILPAAVLSVLTIVLCFVSCTDHNDAGVDAYDLWLKYKEVDNQALLKEYRQLISYICVQGNSGTMEIIREEAGRGLSGLLGHDIPVTDTVINDGALIIGTPAGSGIIGNTAFSPVPDTMGSEGFLIRAADINGKKALVISANEEAGLDVSVLPQGRQCRTGI